MGRIGLPELTIALLVIGLGSWAWRGFGLTRRRSVYVVIVLFVAFFIYQFTRTLTPALPH
jgi:hypothetical protein